MADHLSVEKRSWNMARIKSRDTSPEKRIRLLLHGLGFRYSLHRKDLPGSPDIVMTRYRTVIFIHGCFWHRHKGCRRASTPKTNIAYWQHKFESNINRDRRNSRQLRKLGWNVIVVWECEIANMGKVETKLVARILK
jgi:DNA mismatch endonuclease, patch repair protein